MHEQYSPYIELWFGLNSQTIKEGGLAPKVIDWLGESFTADDLDIIRLMDSWYAEHLEQQRAK